MKNLWRIEKAMPSINKLTPSYITRQLNVRWVSYLMLIYSSSSILFSDNLGPKVHSPSGSFPELFIPKTTLSCRVIRNSSRRASRRRDSTSTGQYVTRTQPRSFQATLVVLVFTVCVLLGGLIVCQCQVFPFHSAAGVFNSPASPPLPTPLNPLCQHCAFEDLGLSWKITAETPSGNDPDNIFIFFTTKLPLKKKL